MVFHLVYFLLSSHTQATWQKESFAMLEGGIWKKICQRMQAHSGVSIGLLPIRPGFKSWQRKNVCSFMAPSFLDFDLVDSCRPLIWDNSWSMDHPPDWLSLVTVEQGWSCCGLENQCLNLGGAQRFVHFFWHRHFLILILLTVNPK